MRVWDHAAKRCRDPGTRASSVVFEFGYAHSPLERTADTDSLPGPAGFDPQACDSLQDLSWRSAQRIVAVRMCCWAYVLLGARPSPVSHPLGPSVSETTIPRELVPPKYPPDLVASFSIFPSWGQYFYSVYSQNISLSGGPSLTFLFNF